MKLLIGFMIPALTGLIIVMVGAISGSETACIYGGLLSIAAIIGMWIYVIVLLFQLR